MKPAVPDYELLRLIGSGAYGEVWIARGVTGAYRAVKVVHRGRFEDQRPFDREFSGIQKFEPVSRLHSSQLAVLHVGRAEDYFYYVMELADDADSKIRNPQSAIRNWETYTPRTLKNELHRRGRLSGDECLRVALSLATALEHLHQHGLIHRDIKPSNIIFVGGVPKLADIGLVAARDATLSFVGTEGFVAPEGPGTPAADIYSLGKVFYEMCTGRDRQEFPELPTALRATPDRETLVEMNEIILKACEHDPRKRYQSTEEMHADLALLQSGKSVRRARGVERQLRSLSHFAFGAAIAIGVIATAWFYQQQQTKEARYWAEQSRQRLVRLHTAQGIQKIEDGDLLGSLPWLVEALKLDQGLAYEETHRFRLGAVLRQSAVITGFWHTPEPAELIEVSPNGRSVLAVRGSMAYLSDLQTERSRTPPLEHNSKVVVASFSKQSDRIITVTDQGEAMVWDEQSGRKICMLSSESVHLKQAIFSPDGKRVATAGPATTGARTVIQIWDADSGKALLASMLSEGMITHLVFSSDERYLATACNEPFGGVVMVWDSYTGRPVSGPHLRATRIRSFLFSPDNRSIYAGDHLGAVIAWDVDSSDVRRIGPAAGHDLAFSPEGSWLALIEDRGSISVQDVRTGRAVGPELNHKRPVRSVAFSPDGRYLLTSGDDGAARLWHIRSGKLVQPPLQHESKVRHVAFLEDGRVAMTVAEQSVRLWDLGLMQPIRDSFLHKNQAILAEMSPDGRRLVTVTDRVGQIWDFWSRQIIGPLRADDHLISAIAFSPDSRFLATASQDRTARIWDLATAQMVTPPLLHDGPVGHVVFHPNQRKIATASGASVRLWDAVSGQPLGPALTLSNRVLAITWERDGNACIVACERLDNQSEVVTLKTDPALEVIRSKPWSGRVIRFLPDTHRMLLVGTTDDLTLRVWDNDTGVPVSPRLKQEHPVTHAALNASRTQAAASSADASVRLWDIQSGELVAPAFTLSHLKGIVRSEYTPDDRFLVTASSEGVVRVWDLAPEKRSIAELDLISSLHAAQGIDASGGAVALSPSRLGDIWSRLKSTQAKLPASSLVAAAWHRREAEECEAMGATGRPEDWRGALFHRSRAESLEPSLRPDLLRRALIFAHMNDWDNAKADYRMALAQGERPDCTVPGQVLLQIIAEDITGYRDSCRQLMARFGTTTNSGLANDAVWLCCLLPDSLSNYDLPVRMMRNAARERPALNPVFNTFGAVLFRAREYAEAVQTLRQAISLAAGEGTPFDLVFLAMAHQALGQSAEARSCLDVAIRLIDKPDPDRSWKWEIELGLLRKEAEQQLSASSR